MYKAPFPYFGGKSRIVDEVWRRIGADSKNYIEPFAGSAAMLLGRPGWSPDQPWTETINDADGLVANFWRALQSAPDDVAHYADWPVNENDLHARHVWLVGQKDSLQSRLEGDPDYYDAKVAGWWVWGMACWIGGEFCSGDNGPWWPVDGKLTNIKSNGNAHTSVARKRVHLSNTGRGVARQRVNLSNAGVGVKRQRVHLGDAGRGVKRQRVHLGGGHDAGTGEAGLLAWMQALAERLRRVRVASGDWSRICGNSVTVNHGSLVAVFLDPPYSAEAKRSKNIYRIDCDRVAHDVREWAIDRGDDPRFRIALCGYDSEHGDMMPDGWSAWAWSANGGYSRIDSVGYANRHREVVWFSPHCLKLQPEVAQMELFEVAS